ncbi:MAG TPA: hypothetical protein VI876_00690 [Dehalococcoidia bacterium]|nr:hypothetical protein [Dehalococcoidia bacterium]
MSRQVLHLDFVSLSPTTGPDDRKQLIEAAAALSSLDRVIAIGVIAGEAGSDFDLAFYFVLSEFAALEPFGTDPRYSRFLQGEVAPRLKSFAGADVRLEDDFAQEGALGAAIALIGPDETYDWEVRDALQAWAQDTGAVSTVVGLAAGERQLYRGVALAFAETLRPAAPPDPERLRAAVVRGRAQALS